MDLLFGSTHCLGNPSETHSDNFVDYTCSDGTKLAAPSCLSEAYPSCRSHNSIIWGYTSLTPNLWKATPVMAVRVIAIVSAITRTKTIVEAIVTVTVTIRMEVQQQ